MKRIGDPSQRLLTLAACAGLALCVAPAAAQLMVYEGFQYNEVGDELIGKPDDDGGADATGLAGTWSDAAASNGMADDMFLKAGNLEFGDLAGAGHHIGFQSNLNNDIYHRELAAEAQAGIAGAGEIWFSFLLEKLQNNFSAGEGGFALANQVLGTPRVFENGGSTALDGLAGFGAGPTTAGNDWTAYAWDGTVKLTGDVAISMPPANGGANTDGSNLGDVRLIVGQVSFDTGAGGTDQYTLYDFKLNDGSVVGGTLNQIAATLEIDVDQGELDTLNLTRQVNLNYDEVRIGRTFADVVPGAAAPVFAITSIDYIPGDNLLTLTWDSQPGEGYTVKYSRDMRDWSADLDDGIQADAGDSTTRTFDLAQAGLAEAACLFFRVERQP